MDDQDNLATIIPVLSYEDEERTKESSTVSKYAYVGSDETSIANFEKFLADVNDALTEEEIAQNIHQYEKYVGPYTFIQNADDGLFYYTNEAMGIVREATACGIFVPEGRTEFTLQVHLTWDGFSTSLKERFDEDSVRYRKAKFKNELSLHFDLNYMAVYFILTELLLCYDSRQKNMMIATWDNKIWYPIFYDMDTMLGLNNYGYNKFNYDEKLLTIGNVKSFRIRSEYFYNLVKNFEENGNTIYDFSAYLDQIFDNDYDLKFSVNTSSSNSCKIMTIHKSKGLEFPICYFAGFSGKFNTQELKERIIYDNKYGLVVQKVDEYYKDTILKTLLKNSTKKEEISEKIRLLYVAVTRAKEKLTI